MRVLGTNCPEGSTTAIKLNYAQAARRHWFKREVDCYVWFYLPAYMGTQVVRDRARPALVALR